MRLPMNASPTLPAARGEGFRPDLEGLRGLAIALVLAFHAGIPGIAGGFVGVDVFFVLSGFLITGLLLHEREKTGHTSLPGFYARRARRILPAATVVLLATLAATVVFAAPLDLPRFAQDAAASAFSAGNLRFADQGMDYFAVGQTPSPFLHYWSLGVEEQFYLVWPALLILAVRGRRPRLGAGVALAAVFAASLVGAVILTDVAAPWAFYSLPSRAWQLAAGGLLACLPLAGGGRRRGAALALAGWAGLAAVIAGAVVLIDPSTPYPGVAALLPTAGAAGLVASGLRRGSPGALLAWGPLRFLGRVSFSLYLVHWPILVLPAAMLPLGAELPLYERLALAAAAVALAYLCWRFVEEPFRRGQMLARLRLARRLVWGNARTLALAGGSIGLTAALCLAISFNAVSALDAPAVASGSDGPAATLDPGPAPGGDTDVSGVQDTPPPDVVVIDPGESPDPTASPDPTVVITPNPTNPPVTKPVVNTGALPADVTPKLSRAAGDWEALKADGCELAYPGTKPLAGCVYGDKNGAITVALVGDSHAGQWFPAVNIIAKREHWKLLPMVKYSCRFTDIRQYSRILKREYTECEAWVDNVAARLATLKPDLTIVAWTRGPGVMNDADNSPARQGVGTANLLANVPGKVALLVDTPQSVYDVPSCLSAHKGDVGACATSRSTAFGWRYLLAEKAAAKALGARATIVNLSDWLCPGKVCPAVLGDHIVYRDFHHLTATFAASLAPALAAKLPDLAP